MRFAQRNIYYLRASPRVVLQTILYIDPQHLRWMNARQYHDDVVGADDDEELGEGTEDDLAELDSTGNDVWARALVSLRHKIMPKLLRESVDGQLLSSTNKKEQVDVHIDRDFQMAYFFRKTTGRHAVLLKEKTLKFPQREPMGPPAMSASAVRSFQAAPAMPASRLAERQQDNESNIVSQGEAIAEERSNGPAGEEALERADGSDASTTSPAPAVRKRRYSSPELGEPSERRVRVKQEDEDIVPFEPDAPVEEQGQIQQEPMQSQPEAIDVEETIDDKKPKLEVSYSGFQIFGKCLIIVIEPTKRVKKSRPGLFQAVHRAEKSQLSATPVPETAGPADTAATSVRAASSRLRSATPRQALDLSDDRADSRRLTTPGARNGGALFRGTPSDWEPTPPPQSRRGSEVPPSPRRSESASIDNGASARGAHSDLDEDEDEDQGAEGEQGDLGSVMLATQMLEGGNMPNQGNDIDDD